MLLQLTKQSTDQEVKAYFEEVLRLTRASEEFLVNLDNAPTAACDLIPTDARFSTVHAALATTPSAPLPTWCASIAPLTRNLIYYCVAVTAASAEYTHENGGK